MAVAEGERLNPNTAAFVAGQIDALRRIDVSPDGTLFTRAAGDAQPTLGELLWSHAARMVMAGQA